VTVTPTTRTAIAVREEGLRFAVTAGRFQLIVDEPESAGGTGQGPQPTDLLLSSVASCFAVALAYSARKRGVELANLTVSATGVYEGPSFSEIRIEVACDHDPAELRGLLSSAERLCYVSNTLKRTPVITVGLSPAG
jgi:uncharacterized OsmC-like protein